MVNVKDRKTRYLFYPFEHCDNNCDREADYATVWPEFERRGHRLLTALQE